MRVRESVFAYGASPRLMTVREYHRAAQKGVFRPDERLELIHGQVINMSPQGSLHASVVSVMRKGLEEHFRDAEVRDHSPLALDSTSEPEPDIIVARGPATRYMDRHPGAEDTYLVVEVADSSLRKDRKLKSTLYAQFQIPEYWIVDLKSRSVEVFREPEEFRDGASRYARSVVFSSSETIEVPRPGVGSLSLEFLKKRSKM